MTAPQQGSGNKQTLTADGNTVVTQLVGPHRVVLSCGFGGGTAKVQVRDPNGVVVDVVDGSFTEAADKIVDFPENELNAVSINIAGSTTPTLSVWIQGKQR